MRNCARLAQSVERWTLNPTVVGSSPTLGAVLQVMSATFSTEIDTHRVHLGLGIDKQLH